MRIEHELRPCRNAEPDLNGLVRRLETDAIRFVADPREQLKLPTSARVHELWLGARLEAVGHVGVLCGKQHSMMAGLAQLADEAGDVEGLLRVPSQAQRRFRTHREGLDTLEMDGVFVVARNARDLAPVA